MFRELDQFIDPDLQKMLAFLLPALAALATLTMSMSRGFSIGRNVFMLVCVGIAIYFGPAFIDIL